MQRWVWVTRPDTWAGLEAVDSSDAELEWTCDPGTGPKDFALLYRAQAKDISHLFRVIEDPDQPWSEPHPTRRGETEWWCRCVIFHKLQDPISLSAIRRHEGLERLASTTDGLPRQRV